MNLVFNERQGDHIDTFRKAFYAIKNKETRGYTISGYKSQEDYGKALKDLMTFLQDEGMFICKLYQQKSCSTDDMFTKAHFLIRKDSDYAVIRLSFNERIFNVVMYSLNDDFVKNYLIIDQEVLNNCNTLCLE